MPPQFTPSELAQQLGVEVETLHVLRQRGTGPSYIKIAPRIIRYLDWDVSSWLDENTAAQDGEP